MYFFVRRVRRLIAVASQEYRHNQSQIERVSIGVTALWMQRADQGGARLDAGTD